MVKNEDKKELLKALTKMREMGINQELLFLFEGVKPLYILMMEALEKGKKEIFEVLERVKSAERMYFKLVRILRSIKDYPWIVDRSLVEKGVRLVITYEYEFGNFVDEIIFGNKGEIEKKIEVLNRIAEKINEVIKEFESAFYFEIY